MSERNEDNDRVFGDRLKAARDLRRMSQGELAEKCRLPPSSISHFESAKRKPSFDNLRKLAAALEVTTDYLLGRSETIATGAEADVLFRDAQKLSNQDRQQALDFIRFLVTRKSGE